MSNMVVRTNVFSINAHRNLKNVGLSQQKAAERLSSGFRVNSAADDAAGLAISESMRAQIRGLDKASINAQDAVGLIQTAEGAMSTVSDMVIRIRELLVQAANDSNTASNRGLIQAEIDQLMQEINDVTFRTQYNTRTLLDGGLTGGGGDVNPVSLQWVLFNQARTVGSARPDGRLEPNNRNQNSLRQDIIDLQNEFNDALESIARRQIADGDLSLSDFDANFRSLISRDPLVSNNNTSSEGFINILQSNGLRHAEVQQISSITNRLNSLVQTGVRTAQEIYQITNDQLNALGGRDAITSNGSGVFMNPAMNEWFDRLYNAHSTLDAATGNWVLSTWYQGGVNPDGTPNPLRNSSFTESDPVEVLGRFLTGAEKSLFHVTQITGSGSGSFNGVSDFDAIINGALSIRPNSPSNDPTNTTELSHLSRGFRLLVGFDNIDGVRVPAHYDPKLPIAVSTARNAVVISGGSADSGDAGLGGAVEVAHNAWGWVFSAISVNNAVTSITPSLNTIFDTIFPFDPPFPYLATSPPTVDSAGLSQVIIDAINTAMHEFSSALHNDLGYPSIRTPYDNAQRAFGTEGSTAGLTNLQTNFTTAQNTLGIRQDELIVAQGERDAAQGALTAARAVLTAAEGVLLATEGVLLASRAALLAAEGDVTAAEAALSAAQAALASDPDNIVLQQAVSAAEAAVTAAKAVETARQNDVTTAEAIEAAAETARSNAMMDVLDADDVLNDARSAFNAAQSAVVTAQNALTTAHLVLNNSISTFVNNALSYVRGVATTRNIVNDNAYRVALGARDQADAVLRAALTAANVAVEANEYEAISALINSNPAAGAPPFPPGGPPVPPFPIDVPPIPSFPAVPAHGVPIIPPYPFNVHVAPDYAPVVQALVDAQNALNAFSMGGLPGPVHPTLPAGTWRAPGTDGAAEAARYWSGEANYALRRSLAEAEAASETPFEIPDYGFVARLENLLDKGLGAFGTVNLENNAMWFQIGANATQGTILQLKGIHTGILGGGRTDLSLLIDVRESNGIPISEQLKIIDIAEGIVNAQRAQLGAVQNRLEFSRQSVDISSENLSEAESRIRDTDMAKEIMRFTQAQVLQQAGISMMAQANQMPEAILQLLQ
ncbi:MAG: hypothetical protein FWE27_08425 [Defluviitaleaceae bacterium]|nr:hypothetical protein [Defluviitaleaceae bacterium]